MKNHKILAGVDQAFFGENIVSAIVLLKGDKAIEKVHFIEKVSFPYIPGLLAFREGPSILKAYEKIKNEPDLIFVDGHGIAHPVNFGLACFVGVSLNKSTIGVAKRKLIGEYKEPRKVGEHNSLFYGEKKIGFVLKSKENCKPIFISPGYKISIENSLKLVKENLKKHKLPEPLRLAHLYANQVKRNVGKLRKNS